MPDVEKANRDEDWLVCMLNKITDDPEVKVALLPGGYFHGYTFSDLGKWFRVLSGVLNVSMSHWFENRAYTTSLSVVKDVLSVSSETGAGTPDFERSLAFNLFYFGCMELSPTDPMAVKDLVAPQLKLDNVDVEQMLARHPFPCCALDIH